MKELELKYGCNRQKPSDLYAGREVICRSKCCADALDISISWMRSPAGCCIGVKRKRPDFRRRLLSNMYLRQVRQSDFRWTRRWQRSTA